MKNSEKSPLHEVILKEIEGRPSLEESSVLMRVLRYGRMPNKKIAVEVFNRLHSISRDPSRYSLVAVGAHQVASEILASINEDEEKSPSAGLSSTPCASGLVVGVRTLPMPTAEVPVGVALLGFSEGYELSGDGADHEDPPSLSEDEEDFGDC